MKVDRNVDRQTHTGTAQKKQNDTGAAFGKAGYKQEPSFRDRTRDLPGADRYIGYDNELPRMYGGRSVPRCHRSGICAAAVLRERQKKLSPEEQSRILAVVDTLVESAGK